MKRTLMKLIAVAIALFVSVGGTVAYLTDVDEAVNVMTLDRVEIDLIEQERGEDGLKDFENDHPMFPGVHPEKPTVGTDGFWTDVRGEVDKIVSIKNTGNASAYVRLWFAFEVPAGDEKFFDEKLLINKNDTDWDWDFITDENGDYVYLTHEDGATYVMATATYPTALATGDQTPASLRQVMLASGVDNEDLATIGDEYTILVVAQGVQSANFNSATAALTAGFGEPSANTHPFAGVTADDPDDPENPGNPDEPDIPSTPVSDFTWEKIDNNTAVRITDYNGSAAAISIPAEIDGLPVTEIGDEAFMGCRSMTSVTLPSTLKQIGAYAFDSCKSLPSVTIPNGVTTIGIFAFSLCDALTEAHLPDSVTSLGDYAYYYCGALSELTLSDNLTELGDSIFYSCTSLKEVIIPDGVESIGIGTFGDCSGMTSVTIPESVTTFGMDPFYAHSDALIANVYAGSAAETYCNANGINVNVITK